MSDPPDRDARTIAEFRANEGRVGGPFEGAPMVLLRYRGRRSGRDYLSPTMYLPHETEADRIYVFATNGGAPTNPDWYRNLTATGGGSVERGTETYQVTVRELTGDERDRIYAEQARRYPGFADHLYLTSSTITATRPAPGYLTSLRPGAATCVITSMVVRGRLPRLATSPALGSLAAACPCSTAPSPAGSPTSRGGSH